jgi:hypothetical protein
MRRSRIIILFVTVALALTLRSYCQDQPQIKTTKGNVCAIDWVKSVIVVRLFDDEIVIFVPDGAKIYRGTESISLADINIGDSVAVEYYNASPGPLRAISIVDMNIAGGMH